jgi:thymidylate synthase (FAD)
MAHVEMCIDTTRDISRQIIRHRSFSFQEFSQRYAAVTLDMVPRECRMQDTTNRQSSLDCEDQRKADAFGHFQTQTWVAAIAVYHEMLKAGVAKEQARALLPEGLTPTRIHMAGTLRSWLHYVGLRGGNGTQREHQWIAESAAKALREHFPTVMAAWEAEE